ncbi:mitochondrial sodium/calcium exchanger protein isoform X6 [Phascolarctos cinereus]|uniref:Sodium/potassium/calcium exchanger 6, mitochondrial isoform X6 n=1 Tax=Phascolarctos cinereus TaxID=38626 RepID=A0A6P5JR27_PHACI|nr:sodium/potassium/calcium exchanger 6, mitochondrial isoform X6 [Phascolarctos cinereus]
MGGSWALSHLQLLGWLWLLRGTCPVLGTGPATQAGSPGPGTVQEGMDSTVDMDCRKVRSLNDSESCVFVLTNPDCQRNGGYFDYLKGVFCFFPPDLLPLAVTLYVLWLFYLFLFLAVTAEKFFCPNLSAISITLKLSHNVAGVTFLAFGNGAPDVFSVLVAFSNSHTAGLGIGALFGAGVLVTTVVAGGIAIIRPFTAASRPFFRDIIFYMAAIFMTFTALYIGKVTLAWGLGYLAFYAFYVFTVVLSTWIYRRHSVAVLSHSPPDPPILPVDSEDRSSSVANSYDYADEYGPQLHEEKSTVWILTRSLTPLDYQTWKRKPYYWKFVKAFKMPVEFLMLLTVPLVDLDRDDRNWKRPLNCLHLLISPVVCVMTLQSGVCLCLPGLLCQRSLDQRGGHRSGERPSHVRHHLPTQQHGPGADPARLGEQYCRCRLRSHSGTAGLPADGLLGLLWGHHLQYPCRCWSGLCARGLQKPCRCKAGV